MPKVEIESPFGIGAHVKWTEVNYIGVVDRTGKRIAEMVPRTGIIKRFGLIMNGPLLAFFDDTPYPDGLYANVLDLEDI